MLRIIILNYERPENVKKIVFSLWKLFPKITVINNNPLYKLPYWGGDIDVINNDKNYFCMERWIRAYEYPEDYKLILDDDILPSPTLIKNMLKSKLPFTGIYGKRGVARAKHYFELEDVWKLGEKHSGKTGQLWTDISKTMAEVADTSSENADLSKKMGSEDFQQLSYQEQMNKALELEEDIK